MESASGSGGLVRSHAGEFEVLSAPTSAFFAGRKPSAGRRAGLKQGPGRTAPETGAGAGA